MLNEGCGGNLTNKQRNKKMKKGEQEEKGVKLR